MADNLLDKASILLTPTAYDNGRMLSVKPNENLYGSELVTNGDFSNGSTGWTISGSASVGVNKLNVNAGAFDFFATQTTLTNGLKYKVTLDVEVTSGGILLYTGTQFGTISSSGSYTFYTTSDSTQIRFRSGGSGFVGSITNVSVVEDLSGDFTFSRSSAATRVNAQGLVENVQIISPELVSNGNFSQIGTEEVLNGNFSQEGSEQISNGSFDTDTKWTTNTGWSISGGSANCDGTQSSNTTLVQQNGIKGAIIDFVVGKTYKVNFDIVVTSGVITQLEVASGVDGNDITTSGNYTTYITAVSTNDRFTITANSDFIGSIDNVSVKEVGQNWTVTNGTITDKYNASMTAYQSGIKITPFVKTGTFKVVFDLVVTSGSCRFDAGGGIDEIYTTSGTKEKIITNPTKFEFNAFNLGWAGSLDNVSVKEVGQDWTFGTGWSIEDGKVYFDNPTGTELYQSLSTTASKYRISFDLDITSGTIQASFSSPSVSTTESFTTSGTKTVDITTTASFSRFRFVGLGGSVFNIDNISVKEITDDTDLPRINYSGFSYQDSLGSELVVNGDFATDSNWNKGASWSIANGNASSDGQSNNSFSQNGILTIGKTYKLTLDLTHTSGTLLLLGAYYETQVQFTSSGSYELFIVPTQNNITFYASSFIGSIDNVSVKEVTGQEVVPDSGCGNWLLEGQSTNFITESESFSSWNKDASVSITSTDKSSPLGTNNASEITVTDSGRLYHDPTISTTADRVTSIFIKAGTFVNFKFTCIVSSEIDLNAETATNNFGIQKLTNGWFRISTTAQSVTSTSRRIQLQAYPDNTYTNGHGQTGTYFVIGTQMENTLLTSYIPTNGATNTRLQDIANNSGNATLINSTEGVLYAEIAALADDGTVRQISISNSSYTNTVLLRYLDLSNKIQGVCRVGGAFKGICTHTLTSSTDFIKVAYKFKNSDFALWVNGVEVATSTDSASFTANTLSELAFDRGDGAEKFEGKTKALVVYKEALTDAELQSLTTI